MPTQVRAHTLRHSDRYVRVAKWLLLTCGAAALLVLAVIPAQTAVRGLNSPYDVDQFRDVAAAQSLVDGKRMQDPLYRGETLWYNPGVPAIVALVSTLTSLDPMPAFVQAGPYVNAFAPAAFFVMACLLYEPGVALVGLVWYLFSPAWEPSWARPCYSPWIFPVNVGGGFMWFGLILCWIAGRRRHPGWWMLAGVALGATFLVHTTAALLLGSCCLVGIAFMPVSRSRAGRERLLALASVIACAAIVSAPLLWSILGHYRLRIVNDAPVTWVWPDITVTHASELLRRAVTPWSAAAVLGVFVHVRRAGRCMASRLLLTWATVAFVMFLFGWLQQRTRTMLFMQFVPQYHFYFYSTAAWYLLAATGVAAVAHMAGRVLSRRAPAARVVRPCVTWVILIGLVAWFVSSNYGRYTHRADFDEYRREAVHFAEDFEATDVIRRIRTSTPVDGVVLASADDSTFRVAPAGRFVVAVRPEFSNPYVRFTPRQRAQNDMLSALRTRDVRLFASLAVPYGVTHVLLGPEDMGSIVRGDAPPRWLKPISAQGGLTLYAVLAEEMSAAMDAR